MSLRHRPAQAAAWPASRPDQPCRAASWEAATADVSGAAEVSAVSTPTYLTNSYDWPACAVKVSAWLAVRFLFPTLRLVESTLTPAPGRQGEAAAPAGGRT